MEFSIDITSAEFEAQIKNSIIESETFQEKINEIITESDEIKEIITEQIKKVLLTDNRINLVIEKEIERYIEEDFSIEDIDITGELTNAIKTILRSRLRTSPY